VPDASSPDEGWTLNLSSWQNLEKMLKKGGPSRIGVTGRPGTGKTDLMSAACRGELASDLKPKIGFVVPAPVNADSNEIARQLVLSLCVEVLRKGPGTRRRGISDGHAGKGALISSVTAVVVGSVLLVLSARGIRINAQIDLGSVLVLAGVVGLLAGFAARVGPMVRFALHRLAKGFSKGGDVPSFTAYIRAAALMDSLEAERRFETTVTSGWAGGLTTSGVQIGTTGSVSKKLLPMPLTELHDRYKTLVTAYCYGEEYLLIGIDELDKRGPGADIDRILYELREFLRTERCRYLIALAEDSDPPSSFRPGLIDKNVSCKLLSFDDAQQFIEPRIPDADRNVAALCFTASGALPGEVVRTTHVVKELYKDESKDSKDKSKDSPKPNLASICSTIVENELQTLSAQLNSAARALPSWTHQQQLFDWAKQLSDRPRAADRILAVAYNIRALAIDKWDMTSHDDPKLQLITDRAAALSYFCATLIDFFKNSLDDKDLERALTSDDAASLDRLAKARRFINLNTCGPAWNNVSAFRSAWEMRATPAASDSAGPNGICQPG
jgi:Cdc6-like AAA superfamily ATPase